MLTYLLQGLHIEKGASSDVPYLWSESKVDHLHSGGAREAAWTNQFIVKSPLQGIDTRLGPGCREYVCCIEVSHELILEHT